MAQYNNATNNNDYNAPVTLSGAGNIIADLADFILGVDNTAAPRTVTLPAPSTTGATVNVGKRYLIKDQSGGAGTNNITIAPAAGTIDGAASVLINTDFGMVQVYCDGVAWFTDATLPPVDFVWSLQAAGTPLLAKQGFISTNAAAQNFALPATCAVGDLFELVQNGAGLVTITQAAGQSIRLGNVVSTVGAGGSVVSSAQGDAIKLICVTANTEFQAVTGVIGNWNLV